MSSSNILALDVGEVRVGVARANNIARIAEPLSTLEVSETIYDDIKSLVEQHDCAVVVVGLPRNMRGEETAQSVRIRAFVGELKQALAVPIVFQDESLTSVKAEQSLQQRKTGYNKGDVDALAAVYILEDYLATSESK
ncbi:Holliday junction resolvase RuvX [Patescibacteria group bacterium]|nr:MAG: Holliday junction resolvase RuvX [Patescibacteria group bacterium]